MRKYLYTNKILVVFILLILSSCSGVFVPDPIDPRLPKYTENGNNVAGALIDDNIWKSVVSIGFPYNNSNRPSFTVWQRKDSLMLSFSGDTQGKRSLIEFHLGGLNIIKFEDLIELEGRKIDLDGIRNVGYYFESYTPSAYDNKGIGQIYFRNVSFDNSFTSIILSGTFGFWANDSNDRIIKVSSGRFDYRINEGDFNQLEGLE